MTPFNVNDEVECEGGLTANIFFVSTCSFGETKQERLISVIVSIQLINSSRVYAQPSLNNLS